MRSCTDFEIEQMCTCPFCFLNQMYCIVVSVTMFVCCFRSKKVKKLLDTIMGGNQSSNHRSTGHTPPANYDMPPLNFHTSHGDNITLSNDGAVATRRESYCKGVLFSHRPVIVGERVCLKICNLSTRWSGVIRVGFSAHDPTNLQGKLIIQLIERNFSGDSFRIKHESSINTALKISKNGNFLNPNTQSIC